MDYVEQFMHWEYTDSLIREQESLQAHINKCLAINEGTPIFVLEAEDKKGIITRIKEFFNKIWVKFKEKLNAMVKNDKEYLTRYKDIIIGKECKLDVTMHDWFVGIRRFNTTIDKVIEEANSTFIKDAGTSDQIIKNIEEILGDKNLTTNKEDNSIDIDTGKVKNKIYLRVYGNILTNNDKLNSEDKYTFTEGTLGDKTSILKHYYFGGEDEESFTPEQMNSNDRMSVIFNELYSADMLMKKLQALKNAHDKGMEKLNKSLNTLQTSTVQLNKESYIYESKFDYNKKSTSDGTTNNTNIDNKQQTDSANNMSDAAAKVKDTHNKSQENVTDADSLNKDLHDKHSDNANKANISKYLTAYNTSVEAFGSSITSIFAAMCTAREAMRKDFRNLVRAHVNSYLSDSEGNNTNKTTTATDQGTNVGKQEPNNPENASQGQPTPADGTGQGTSTVTVKPHKQQ